MGQGAMTHEDIISRLPWAHAHSIREPHHDNHVRRIRSGCDGATTTGITSAASSYRPQTGTATLRHRRVFETAAPGRRASPGRVPSTRAARALRSRGREGASPARPRPSEAGLSANGASAWGSATDITPRRKTSSRCCRSRCSHYLLLSWENLRTTVLRHPFSTASAALRLDSKDPTLHPATTEHVRGGHALRVDGYVAVGGWRSRPDIVLPSTRTDRKIASPSSSGVEHEGSGTI